VIVTDIEQGYEGDEVCAVCDCSLLSHQMTPDMEHEFEELKRL
jgi:hypothetical protein